MPTVFALMGVGSYEGIPCECQNIETGWSVALGWLFG